MSERLPNGNFPYTLTFESGSEHRGEVEDEAELTAVLRDYGVDSKIQVSYEGDSQRQMMS